MIKLSNRTKQIQVFNLPHAYRCSETWCFCTPTELRLVEALPDGSTGVRVVGRQICSSLTLLAGETSGELPVEVARAPEVKAALDRQVLRLIQVQSQAAKPAAPPAPPSPGTRRGNK